MLALIEGRDRPTGRADRRAAGDDQLLPRTIRARSSSWLGWHARLSALPLLFGLIISLPLGWLARRYRWLYPPMVSLAGLLYTIPSLALFILLPGILKTKILDPNNVVVALTIYTVALLVRVVADGLAVGAGGGAAGRDRDGLSPFRPAGQGGTADRGAGDRAPGCGWRRCPTSAWCRCRR